LFISDFPVLSDGEFHGELESGFLKTVNLGIQKKEEAAQVAHQVHGVSLHGE
jgi:hypothetical protein